MAETKKEINVENNELKDKELKDISAGAGWDPNTSRKCKKCGATLVDVNYPLCADCRKDM